jgi:hypothetical protein
MRTTLLAALLLVAGDTGAATLTQGPGDQVGTCFFAASVRIDASDPNVAWIGCPSIAAGAFPFSIDPSGGLGAAGAPVLLPPIGAGVFLDDIWVERADLAWMTTSGTEAVLPFDPVARQLVPVRFEGSLQAHAPTQRTITGSFWRSDGSPISSFQTDYTSGVTRVGDRLVVVSSNFFSEGLNPVNDPGTLLFFDIDESQPGEIGVSFAGYLITSDFNPSAVTALPNGLVAVTNSGVIRLTTPPSATSGGSVDIVDPQAQALLTSIPLGLAGPAYRELAWESTGSVALLGSAVFRQLYAFDLRGLDSLPDPGIDETRQRTSCNDGGGAGLPCAGHRVLRGVPNPIPIPPSPQGAPTSEGFVPEVRFGASDDFAVATAADDGLLVLLPFDPRSVDGPHPLLDSRFGPVETFQVTPSVELSGGQDRSPGPMDLRASPGGGLDGTLVVYGTFVNLNRGTLGGTLPGPTGDFDADTYEDSVDLCPLEPDPAQSDLGQIGGFGPDGIGDACQCGDQTGDGAVDASDLAAIESCLSGALACATLCDATHDGACDAADLTALQLALVAAGSVRCAAFSLP